MSDSELQIDEFLAEKARYFKFRNYYKNFSPMYSYDYHTKRCYYRHPDPNHWTEGGTGIGNIRKELAGAYMQAIADSGFTKLKIHYHCYNKPTDTSMWSLHNMGGRNDLSGFWKVFNANPAVNEFYEKYRQNYKISTKVNDNPTHHPLDLTSAGVGLYNIDVGYANIQQVNTKVANYIWRLRQIIKTAGLSENPRKNVENIFKG